MKELALAGVCMLGEIVLLGPRPRTPSPEQVRANLARLREPYFGAFLRRCMTSVYPSKSDWGDRR